MNSLIGESKKEFLEEFLNKLLKTYKLLHEQNSEKKIRNNPRKNSWINSRSHLYGCETAPIMLTELNKG